MTHFIRQGNTYTATPEAAIDIQPELPVGTYVVKFNELAGQFFLEEVEGFSLPPKLYGDTLTTADRIFTTFKDRTASTGVLLTGEKGSGKTLLSKKLSIMAKEEGIPTIVVNQPHFGDGFNTFMQSISQPVVVLFDEFEKVYKPDQQEGMLTLLDGVYPSRKLFILTTNNAWRVDSHMRNRPGRLFYSIKYKGLDPDFVREYCEDVLINKEHVEAVAKLSIIFDAFNFDMLKALVEEMNRYDESPNDAMQLLNAKPEYGDAAVYDVKLTSGAGGAITGVRETWNGNPLVSPVNLDYIDDTVNYQEAQFNTSHLVAIDNKTGAITFVNKAGDKLELSRHVAPSLSSYHGF